MWFAWKIVLLQYRKQPKIINNPDLTSCDLLGKSYFCSIANNHCCCRGSQTHVVICLENRTFAVSQTTRKRAVPARWLLWFAWKIVLLQYRKQPWGDNTQTCRRCDLLGKSYFCSIANNRNYAALVVLEVVICLENRTFAVSQTTYTSLGGNIAQLWFAWKIVLLQYRKQLELFILPQRFSCDLLGKSYFCSIANNLGIVVAWYVPLWFAWKIVLLQYRKQPIRISLFVLLCCDLLGKSYFCSIANNSSPSNLSNLLVVICLENRTFAVSQTTTRWSSYKLISCDLLGKSYFCSIANNHLQ